ncbi:MAG: ribonuclease Z [Thermoplasmata archaeon]
MISTIKLVFLGTSGSWPSPERGMPSIGVQLDSECILFDVGEGTQRQLMMSSLSFMKITKIFITHFHGDHFLGLGGLIQTMTLNDRKEKLEIYGPPDTIRQVSTFLNLGYYSLSFPIFVREIEDNEVLDFGDYTIKAIRAKHPVHSFSYILKEKDRKRISRELMEKYSLTSKEVDIITRNGSINKNGKIITLDDISDGIRKGRSIVYSGDTSPNDLLAEESKNMKIMVHEATVDSSLESKANEYGHSSARQAAELAKKANVEYLYLTHISPRYRADKVKLIENEAKSIFERTVVARDFMEIMVQV